MYSDGPRRRTCTQPLLPRYSSTQVLLYPQTNWCGQPVPERGVEIYNDKLAVRTRTLLYGSGLPAKFWSAALVHSAYLHNRLVHSDTGKTSFEGYFGKKPDISSLKLFGSRVCVRCTGARRAKLDCHDFTGIFSRLLGVRPEYFLPRFGVGPCQAQPPCLVQRSLVPATKMTPRRPAALRPRSRGRQLWPATRRYLGVRGYPSITYRQCPMALHTSSHR